MSTNSALDAEDLANVALVRMEDVQPPRIDRIITSMSSKKSQDELQTCIDDSYEQCFDEDDSNIGSMVSIKSTEIGPDHSYCERLIVEDLPEPLDEAYIEVETTPQVEKVATTDSWPTLEILPGGVIKRPKHNKDFSSDKKTESHSLNEIYACAKCSNSFKDLYSLVKHVKWHEDEKKLDDSRRMVSQVITGNVFQNGLKKRKIPENKSIKKKIPKKRNFTIHPH